MFLGWVLPTLGDVVHKSLPCVLKASRFLIQPNMAHSVYATFKAMSGASCIIQVAPGDSVMNAKTNAAFKLGLTASCTRLMLHGKWLNDDGDFYNMGPDQFNGVHILTVEPDTTETNSTDKHTDSTTETNSTDKHTDSTTETTSTDKHTDSTTAVSTSDP